MSNQLEKLKNSIKKEYTDNFELNLMKSSGFVPVDKRQTDFYVILDKTKAGQKTQIEKLIKEKYNELTPKFIPVESGDFSEIIKSISTEQPPQTTQAKPNAEPTAEDMLVGIGWITQSQLEECAKEAETTKIPIDGVFRNKGYLNAEQAASYLKKKYGFEVIDKSNIVLDPKIIKMLPDDFMEKKRVVVMSPEGDKLGVAMVDPLDKYTIREISLSTGRSLNLYTISYTDFEAFIKEYTIIKKSQENAKETERIIQSIEEETAQYNQEESLWTQVEKELQDASGNVAKFVYKIITDAIDAKASDIHIEPRIGYYVVRVRSDGILKKVLEIPGSILKFLQG